MSNIPKLFSEVLRKNGCSLTKVRQAVFEALEEKGPLSMNELVNKVKPSVDRASVYRTIALFEELGIVQRIQLGWKYKLELSDLFNYHHHHISCSKCGTVSPIKEDAILEASVQAIAQEYGFQTTRHQIEIQGICRNCQDSMRPQ
jgi:Fur family transcriptional regulator, ferric uptake regulator